jgi:hypothetical protein
MTMKGWLIDGQAKSIEAVDIASPADIAPLVGFDSVITDDVGACDRVYFDEDCFIRGTEGRFRIDSLPPIAGRAVVLGSRDGEAVDCSLDQADLERRISFD